MLSRTMAILGLLAMLLGGLDPLEGSVIILPGVGMAAVGAALGRSRYTRLLWWALGLVAIGVGAMFALSAIGGIGGPRGRSMWWGVFIAPYPIGFVLGLVLAVLRIVEAFRGNRAATARERLSL